VGESINRDIAFLASRYDKGDAYLNCPMNREQYLRFWQELCSAQQVELKDFERETAKFFEACLPIEELARRGKTHGPLSLWGCLTLVREISAPQRISRSVPTRWCSCGKKIRQVNCGIWWASRRIYAGVSRVFQLIPGLKMLVCAIGVMHRNTFINAPSCYTDAAI